MATALETLATIVFSWPIQIKWIMMEMVLVFLATLTAMLVLSPVSTVMKTKMDYIHLMTTVLMYLTSINPTWISMK